MPISRSKQVCLQATSFYHCMSRCVRRAFLCGDDKLTNKNFDHRRDWIEKRLLFLASVFNIDVCSYAVMSNHFHVVLHINVSENKSLSNMEVAQRWTQICKGTLLVQKFVKGEPIDDYLQDTLDNSIAIYRQRLSDISWFMRMLNEPIARLANQEDECTGRFWEGRFKSQALLDESAVASCMAYVDLNPVRAGESKTPEESMHTSIYLRCKKLKENTQPSSLMPFQGDDNGSEVLPFKCVDYLKLVELTGRCIKEGKIGAISQNKPDILNRLSISAESWMTLTTQFEALFQGAVGAPESLSYFTHVSDRQRRCNFGVSMKLLA